MTAIGIWSRQLGELGVVDHVGVSEDEATKYWRARFYVDGNDPVELLFDDEPEHRVIETVIDLFDAISVRVIPSTAKPAATSGEAAERLLAVARGLAPDKALDPSGMSDLITAALDYQSLYRREAVES